MKAYFLEHFPIDHKEEWLSISKGSKVLALTPLACYQLDELNIEYEIPEDYHYPERLNIKEVYDSFEFNKDIINIFVLSLLEVKETETFWRKFLDVYFEKNKIDDIKYFGTDYKILQGVLYERKI